MRLVCGGLCLIVCALLVWVSYGLRVVCALFKCGVWGVWFCCWRRGLVDYVRCSAGLGGVVGLSV